MVWIQLLHFVLMETLDWSIERRKVKARSQISQKRRRNSVKKRILKMTFNLVSSLVLKKYKKLNFIKKE